MGLSREREGIAAKALSDTGAEYDRVRGIVVEHHREQAGQGSDPEPFSPSIMRVLERSLEISWSQADGGIDTEHLLVALLEQDDAATEAVLAELSITPEEVVQRIDALLAERTA